MKTLHKTFFAAVLAAAPLLLSAQDTGGLKTVAIAGVKVNPAVISAAAEKKNSLDRMAQAMDGQLMDRLQNTRKFQLIARSDADALIEEAAATGRTFDFGEADYLLVVTIDDFQDLHETARFENLGQTAQRRIIRFSTVGRIYDAKTNLLIESTNFQEQTMDSEQLVQGVRTDGQISDQLLLALTRRMAEKISERVVDVTFPARVIAKTGRTVTINRGDGTGIARGQLWEVFALGEEMVDPDTGVSYGREEISVGNVRVTRVTPQFAQADVVDDFGIERGAVLRRVTE